MPKTLNTHLVRLGNRIAQRRADLKMRQEDLAIMLEVDRATVSQYESGKVNLAYTQLLRLCEVLDTHLDYLAHGRTRPIALTADEILETISKSLDEPFMRDKVLRMLLHLDEPEPTDKA